MALHHHARTPRFGGSADRDFDTRTVLGFAPSGAADIGEVLAAIDGVAPHDVHGWFAAWDGLGDRVGSAAAQAKDAGHRVSAAWAYLRASAYYGAALNAAAGIDDDAHVVPSFRKSRDAWDAWADLSGLDVERVEIPFESTALPGYFFRSGPGARPTIIAVNGSDATLTWVWAVCASGALARGYNVLAFDGPGQQSVLFDQGIPFRPDWEAVVGPVIDALTDRPDVDPDRIALYGGSQGGYWVARAAAFEHRIAAAIADPGVVDVSTSWTDHLPSHLMQLLERGDDAQFDRDMQIGLRFSPDVARTWAFRARPYGEGAYADVLRRVRQYTVADLAAQITAPLLITSPENEQFWPGQSEKLHALTPGVSTLMPFTAAEGADLHCEPLARTLVAERMFDWLDEQLQPAASAAGA